MLLRTIAAFSLALSSSAFSAESTYEFSHYSCGTVIPHVFDDSGRIIKVQGSELRPANVPQEDIFTAGNWFRKDVEDAKTLIEKVIVAADGTLTVIGVVDIPDFNEKGGGFQGRTITTYTDKGDHYVDGFHQYEATKKSTGEVIEYALGAPGDAGQAGWSVYHASHFIEPMLPVFTADIRVTDSTVAINLQREREGVRLLCGDNATAYAVFTK